MNNEFISYHSQIKKHELQPKHCLVGEITAALPADASAIFKLIENEAHTGDNTVLARPLETIEQGTQKGEWIICRGWDGAVIGCSALEEYLPGEIAEIRSVVVHPQKRAGYGIGTALVHAAIQRAQEHNIKRLFLTANERNKSFYERMGFEGSNRFVAWYTPQKDTLPERSVVFSTRIRSARYDDIGEITRLVTGQSENGSRIYQPDMISSVRDRFLILTNGHQIQAAFCDRYYDRRIGQVALYIDTGKPWDFSDAVYDLVSYGLAGVRESGVGQVLAIADEPVISILRESGMKEDKTGKFALWWHNGESV